MKQKIELELDIPEDFDIDDLWELEQAAQEWLNDNYGGDEPDDEDESEPGIVDIISPLL